MARRAAFPAECRPTAGVRSDHAKLDRTALGRGAPPEPRRRLLDEAARLWQHEPRHGYRDRDRDLDTALAERGRVIRTIRQHGADLRALGVTRLWLFGSLARGDARPDSDVDVLIDIVPGRRFSLLDLAEVRLALCDLLGREAGVVIRADLRPDFRDTIADDLVEVL